MERHTRLSRAAVVLVAIALIASIAAAVWFASPDAPYVPSEDSGAALGTAAPAEDGYAEHETTVPAGYTPVRSDGDVDTMRSNGRNSSGKYILMGNITIDSIDLTAWTGEDGTPWKSELDGNGYTITINATASGEYYDTGGLFSVIGGGAYVHDLTIVVQNVRVDNTANEGSANFGVIAGNACGAVTVDNVYIRLDKDSSDNGDAYVSSNGTTWLGGVFGKVEGSDVSISNTTVYNAAAGNRGFSGTMNINAGVYVGGFVGSIDRGDLTVSNIAYKADDDAKIFAVAENAAGWFDDNTTLTGGVLGYHNEGSFTLDGLIFDAQVTLGSNTPNFGTQNGETAHAAYIVGLVDGGLSDTWSNIYINAANGNEWLDGNNQTRGSFINYNADTFTDARFADDGRIAFAVSRQNPANAGSVIRTVVQENTTTTISDAEIADIVSSGDGPAWITVDRVNATGKNSLSIGSYATAGAYNVQNYNTVSSADDSAYRGSKVYDGTTVTTPTLNVGGTTVNAWTADSTTADVGAKTFSYNASALSGYAAAAYNGGTYLVKDGTIYSPGTITVNGAAQTFALGKNFVYEITQAPVTVTPSAPTDLYAGNPLPELTATAVDSGGSPVEGSIEWDDPDATLISGKHSYAWTWTPLSSNYQTVTGSIELEAFDRAIDHLTIEGEFKTEYTAFESFDPTGVEVIAHYTDGSSEQLVNDEYEFTVVNGDKDRLIVGNNTVTVSLKKGSGASATITITVSKLAVDVPNENQGLVYTGGELTGVAASADNYYSLKGNTGTNAAAYTATATLTDTANTRWNTADANDTTPKEIEWSIAKKDVDITVEHTSKTYDGQEVDPTTLFTAKGVNNEALDLTVAVDGGKTILNADTYSVTASLAESETNYTAEPLTITYKVDKKLVSGEIVADDLVYDGTEKGATFNGQLIGEDKVEIKYVGDRVNVTEAGFTATAVLPSGDNYAWADGVAPSATFMISPKTVNVTATSGSKEFAWIMASASELYELFELDGEKVNAEDKLIWKVNGEVVDMSDGNVSEIFDAKEYRIEIASADANYTLTGQTSTTFTITPKKVEKPTVSDVREFTYNGGEQGFTIVENDEYTVTGTAKATDAGEYSFTIALKAPGNVVWSDGTTETITIEWSIAKADPAVTVKLSDDMPGNLTVAATLDNAWLVRTDNTGVEGTLAWDKAGELLQQGEVEYGWTFVPTDSNNYNNVTGSLSITASEDTLQSITVKDGTYKTEYTAYEDFDPTGLVVIAHYASGAKVEVTSGFTLEKDKALTDGQITVTLNGVSTTITVTVNKREIPLPAATEGLIFNGEEQNGIDQKWIEQYAEFVKVEGNSQRDAGDYRATVTLTKDTNYVTWKGGSTDAQTIGWSIAYVTIEVTVNAESKTVEYGTAYSWDPYDFFAVEVTNSDLFEVELGVFNDDSTTDISTANVGKYSEGIFASVTRKDGGALGEQDLASFKFSQDIRQLAMKVIVTAKTVEVALDENVDFAAYDGEKLSKEELFGMFKTEMNIEDLAFEVDDVPYDEAEIVNAGEYTVKVVSANDNYDLTGTTEGVYKIAKATLTVTASAESEGLDTSDDLYAVPLNVKGVGVNGEEVSGTGVWASGQSLSPGTNKYKFVFTPDQEFAVNYEVCEGECEIANVAQATLTDVSVEIVATTEYVAFDAFDRSSIVVEALYGEDRKPVTGYTLTFSIGAEDRLFAGTGITVTVTYTDGEVTQSTEFTIDVAKRAVAKPVVDTTVFDATGETITLPIAESEYYTVYGNTAIEPGRYVATVELKDPANTMWEDGSTDVVSIAWTISEPVTSDEVIADILAMEKVTWQNAEEFLDLEARYNALDESEQTAEATEKLATLKAQYDALRASALDDIKAAHEVTAKSLGKALAAAAAGLSAAAIALAIAKRRSI